MGKSRGIRMCRGCLDPKPSEAGCGLQEIIPFLSLEEVSGSPKDIRGGVVHIVAEGPGSEACSGW